MRWLEIFLRTMENYQCTNNIQWDYVQLLIWTPVITVYRWLEVKQWPEGPACFSLKGLLRLVCDVWSTFSRSRHELHVFHQPSDPQEDSGRCTAYYREGSLSEGVISTRRCVYMCLNVYPPRLALYAAAWSCKQHLQSCLSLIVTVGSLLFNLVFRGAGHLR